MKYLILIVLLSGCILSPAPQRTYVNCENGFKGYVKRVFIDEDGTRLHLVDGKIIEYSVTIKCEAITEEIK